MHYAVLDGISPDYPAVAGRLHTCYSPVRRSPAGKGKPSPPLPLDLHVLSLSLAFILSQDQTLRCCYLLFFFFLVLIDRHESPKGNRPTVAPDRNKPTITRRALSTTRTNP